MKTREELNAFFAAARDQRMAIVRELKGLSPQDRRERLEKEPLLVRAVIGSWENPRTLGKCSVVGRNKSDQKAVEEQLWRIQTAAIEAAKRFYGYKDCRPLKSKDARSEAAWIEAVNDMLAELPNVPLSVVTYEFERALFAYH